MWPSSLHSHVEYPFYILEERTAPPTVACVLSRHGLKRLLSRRPAAYQPSLPCRRQRIAAAPRRERLCPCVMVRAGRQLLSASIITALADPQAVAARCVHNVCCCLCQRQYIFAARVFGGSAGLRRAAIACDSSRSAATNRRRQAPINAHRIIFVRDLLRRVTITSPVALSQAISLLKPFIHNKKKRPLATTPARMRGFAGASARHRDAARAISAAIAQSGWRQ